MCVLWDKCKWEERTSTTTTYSFLDFELRLFFFLRWLSSSSKERTSRSSRDADTIWHSRIGLPLTFFWPSQKRRRRRRIWWRALSRHVSVEMNRCRSIWERPAAATAVADDCRLPLTYLLILLSVKKHQQQMPMFTYIVHFHIKILSVRRLLSTVELQNAKFKGRVAAV